MNKKLMKTLKFGFLIFGISLLFTNCEKDEFISENDINIIINTDSISNNNPFGFTIQTLELKDIESNTEILDKIENIKNKSNKSNKAGTASKNIKNPKTVYSSDQSFIIDTGIVKYMQNQDSTYHSYTFPIYRANNNSGLENLMLSSQDDGTYKTYIVTYELTEQEILNLNNNLPVDLKNKVTHTEFKDEQLVDNIFARESRLPTTIFIVFEGPCDCHTTHAAGGCTHPKSSTSSFTSNTSPGAGHNTSYTGNQSNQNNYNYGGATSPTSSLTIKESLIFYITEIVGLNGQEEYLLKSFNNKELKEIKSFLTNSNTEEVESITKEIIDSKKANSLVSFFPFIKYPPNSNYDTLYPKLTEYLKNQLPKVADIPLIVDTIKGLTGLTESQIKEDLKWGKGPTIHITQLDNFSERTSDKTVGRFEESEPDVLHLDIDYVNKLENSTASQDEKDAFLFYLGTTILHEYVHYGDFQDGVQLPFEEGIRFELYVYGENVNSENATLILNRK